MMILLVVVVFLFAFASGKNASRKVSEVVINFKGDQNLFITYGTVSKLLIQNQGEIKNMPKETLALNTLENALKSNPLVKTAEVYVSVNGTLIADVEQKRPIARISTNASYYVDDEGYDMPLSTNYSARVPLVTGYIEKNNLKNVFTIAQKVENDPFLKKNVIEIHQNIDNVLFLKLRQCQFLVQIGSIESLDKKINNLKAFYQKNLEDKRLNDYSKVNLQFDNQVVCTKR
ncbi:cell division protein FtsQ/DivIB [Mariniflexile ostreae]|uniref:Cell division protein FtsQ/DivIB n=1 Tax=Mariniflexile ostreae TaxID=1520892 RepID=A0ABV5FBY6_9FLAO